MPIVVRIDVELARRSLDAFNAAVLAEITRLKVRTLQRKLTEAGRHYATICNGVTSAMVDTIGEQPRSDPRAVKPCAFDDFINAAHRAARALRAGTVYVNCYDADDITVPFGGYKQSGNGREWGDYAFNEFLEVKTLLGFGA